MPRHKQRAPFTMQAPKLVNIAPVSWWVGIEDRAVFDARVAAQQTRLRASKTNYILPFRLLGMPSIGASGRKFLEGKGEA